MTLLYKAKDSHMNLLADGNYYQVGEVQLLIQRVSKVLVQELYFTSVSTERQVVAEFWIIKQVSLLGRQNV